MGRLFNVSPGYRWLVLVAAAASLMVYAACQTASRPAQVAGPAVTGNRPATIAITDPTANRTINQGDTFAITWTDQDQDSAALISFALVNTDPIASPTTVSLVEGIPENDTAASDTITVSTAFVPRGSYYLQATISDGVNPPATAFATTPAPASTRVVITVGEEGATPSNRPPTIFVTQPQFNLSVTLDDTITIGIQPSSQPPNANVPYDPDNDALLYLSLDLDDDPATGNPLNPDPEELILLLDAPFEITQGTFAPFSFEVSVDLARFPLREDGKPYFIRATITDGSNARRDAYATGTINVTRAATGRVDLGMVGGTLTGATWLGFDPGALLGTAMASIGNFDAGSGATETDPTGDVVEDCLLVAQFGVPTGLEPTGEAYLIYGLNGRRFGGRINVNTVGTEVDGATFVGPQARNPSEETNGITSVGFVPDLTGDGRPELLFGASYVDGVRQFRDDDPSDRKEGDRETVVAKIQRGSLTVTRVDVFGNEAAEPEYATQAYDDVIDTVVDLNDPDNTAAGTATLLSWGGEEIDQQFTPTQWVLIQYNLVDFSVPDFLFLPQEDIEIASATLFISVGVRGDDSEVHALFRSISQTTTLNSFSGGLAPVEDVQYDQDGVQGTGFQDVVTGENSVDVTDTVEDIFDNRQDLYGWIIIPTDLLPVILDSSEAGVVEVRPRLEIRYTRPVPGGAFDLDGCYPDLLPNNTSNNPDAQGSQDDIIANRGNLESLGIVAMVDSENRDADGIVDLERLNRATVPIDLAGQRPTQDTGFAHAVIGLGAVGPSVRLEGARFQVAMYDVIDVQQLDQGPIRAEFGARVGSLPDIGNDQRPEIIVSAPRNEMDVADLTERFSDRLWQVTHLNSRPHQGNIVIYHGQNYNLLRDLADGSSSLPHIARIAPVGSCNDPVMPRGIQGGQDYDSLVIHGEKPSDELGDGSSAGDFNLDGSPDVLCGAPFADGPTGENVGTTYIVYQRQQNEDVEIQLADANDPSKRPPMIRIRGDEPEDRIGWAQESVLDINGDRINDIAIGSPYADAGGVQAGVCSRDFNSNGSVDSEDNAAFSSCRAEFGEADLFSDDPCAFFDYNNDRRVDDLDADVFEGGACPVDNGTVAVVFGGITLDGDRVVSQIATPDLPGVVFYGANRGDRAGHDVTSAGDFNRDGFGDLLITAPGARATADDGTTRVGVVYLIFGGPHLNNRRFSLANLGTADLPGIIFLSPYEVGAPNEAPPQYVAGLGDLNNDGFADIGIGNPLADFVDTTFPQEPGSPGSDLSTGRRRDAGEIYMIYGHNITASNP
ncbi:MAG: Ser-Thr-rich GPI-anchored membrane family protein [Planctomycetota bacterium]